ncbi:GMC oxidoreductase [Alloyangia pacifica]|uniref:GMC oxidoreductase n=1 Tax=Alloyangia pacifica TaxID=311180 RepID=UPI001CFC53C9|nr:GMC oxidoreductase [Alloyangia pacifica]
MPYVTQETACQIHYDLCVIGAGAAGLAVADSARQNGLSVLIVERGGEIASVPRREPLLPVGSPHDPAHKTTREGLGGTLSIWGGRCVPFDPEDFSDRPGLGASWPISYEDYAAWVPAASALFEVEPRYNVATPADWPTLEGIRMDTVELLSRHWFPAELRDRLTGPNGPDILLDTEVTGMSWSDRRVRAISVTGSAGAVSISAADVVLACGGLQSTQLLLEEERRKPGRLRGASWLGRGYMGHLTGSISEITFRDAQTAAAFTYNARPDSAPGRRRFLMLPPDGPHIALWIESIAPGDPRHGSAEISAKTLLRGAPSGTWAAHLANVLRRPTEPLSGLRAAMRRARHPDQRFPDRLIARRPGPYRLAYHAEHLPSPTSIAALCPRPGPDGTRPLRIDFDYGADTIQGTVEAHRKLARALEDSGFARLELDPDDDVLAQRVRAAARDGYHQIGLTRMSCSADKGVVDEGCRVFGTDNLYVASASVFPTSSQANPTLTIVALALRLADRLVANQQRGTSAGSAVA